MKKIIILSLLCCTSILLAEKPCSCYISLYIDDSDTNGANLRHSPGGEVALVIPYHSDSYPIIDISAYQNGWFKISKIQYLNSYIKVLFPLWIHNSVASSTIESEFVRLYTIPGGNLFKEVKVEGKFVFAGCKGEWIKCYFTEGALKGVSGWLPPGSTCEVGHYTTCP